MSEPRWTDETLRLVRRHISSAITAVNHASPADRWDLTVERAEGLLDGLANAGLLAEAGLLVESEVATLGWEVLTRQPDGTWLADWDAKTHESRETAEQEATTAASRAHLINHGVGYPARVARLVADGPIHEPKDVDDEPSS